jgi:peptidoglycan/xylan/chitin deacetylase (PgdA/CDA1 family)
MLLAQKKIFCINFHNPSIIYFERHIEFFSKNGFKFISLDVLKAYLIDNIKIPQASVMITFDDGWQDNMRLLPIVEKYNIPVCFFLNTNETENRKCHGKICKVITRPDLIELVKKSYISIGSHTHSHLVATEVPPGLLENEISVNISLLKQWSGKKIFAFAYPEGKYNQEVIKVLQKLGLEMAFTINSGYLNSKQNLYLLPRFGVTERSFDESICKITGLWNEVFHKKELSKLITE